MGSKIAGAFDVEHVLGQGGMGTVYKGQDVRLGRPVAIKVLRPSFEDEERALRRFDREARAVAALGHQHIVTIYDIGSTEVDGLDVGYLVMEYLEGDNLSDRLRERGPLPTDQAARILAQTARALQAAHDKGLVHRDLKPENLVLVERDGRTTSRSSTSGWRSRTASRPTTRPA